MIEMHFTSTLNAERLDMRLTHPNGATIKVSWNLPVGTPHPELGEALAFLEEAMLADDEEGDLLDLVQQVVGQSDSDDDNLAVAEEGT